MKKKSFTAAILAPAALVFGLTTSAQALPFQWTAASGGNDHWYEIIWENVGAITWNQANNFAQGRSHLGQTGYLASITSAAEQAFANFVNNAFTTASPNHSGTYVRAWLGGNDIANEGAWEWTSGESFSYTNWNFREPNNYRGEDNLVGWWSGDGWNDCSGTCGTYKYLIEYDNAPAPVPVPASLPLLVAGFGALRLLRRRKKS